jgi:predicted alpha/beta-fold hydrolase
MPILDSDYKAPLLMTNNHLQTVYQTLFRKIQPVPYRRERVKTKGKDFIDLDFSETGSDRIVIIIHGLEGNSTRQYMYGMVRAFNDAGFDTASFNCLGCSGEPNRTLRFSHSGATAELDDVVRYLKKKKLYRSCHIVGFSLGGNITLKYIGEQGKKIDPFVTSAVAFSVPCDLTDSSSELDKKHNRIYMRRFLIMLGNKLRAKQHLFKGKISLDGYESITSFSEFDNRYTAPIHGFKNAADYWVRSSSKPFLKNITIPALLVSALDDPFLGKRSIPVDEARNSAKFFLETPKHGGHVGFVTLFARHYWHEKRAVRFVMEHLAETEKSPVKKKPSAHARQIEKGNSRGR